MRSQHDYIIIFFFATTMQLFSLVRRVVTFMKKNCIKLESFLRKLKSSGGIVFTVHENG